MTAASIYVLDVGHGNCALALGDGWTVMVDAARDATVVETIEHLRLRRLDVVIVSHRDADHANGLIRLLGREDLEIGAIYIPADATKNPLATYTDLLLAALEDAKRGGRCHVSRDLDSSMPPEGLQGGGLGIEILGPSFRTIMTGAGGQSPAGGRLTSNSVSAVVRITLPDGLRVLLPGDMDHVALRELMEAGTDMRADVLVFPHHGSHSQVPDECEFAATVVGQVQPGTVLFSIGRGAHVRPSEGVLRGVFEADPDVHVACTQLSKGCVRDDAALPQMADHLSPVPASGKRQPCQSCAGSVVLAGAGMAEPTTVAHRDFVSSVAQESAMCRRLRP